MVTILSVEPRDDFTLFLTFDNGKKGVFDVKPYLQSGSMFLPLKNLSLFKSVKVTDISIEWANGADLCPDCIYSETKFA
jgi:hypothetical protein